MSTSFVFGANMWRKWM